MKPHPSAVFPPDGMKVEFDGKLAEKVYNWLQEEGDKIAYVYGGSDTWSATSVPQSKKVDAIWIMMPGIDHGKARIRNMTDKERLLFITTIEQWLDLEIEDIYSK